MAWLTTYDLSTVNIKKGLPQPSDPEFAHSELLLKRGSVSQQQKIVQIETPHQSSHHVQQTSHKDSLAQKSNQNEPESAPQQQQQTTQIESLHKPNQKSRPNTPGETRIEDHMNAILDQYKKGTKRSMETKEENRNLHAKVAKLEDELARVKEEALKDNNKCIVCKSACLTVCGIACFKYVHLCLYYTFLQISDFQLKNVSVNTLSGNQTRTRAISS